MQHNTDLNLYQPGTPRLLALAAAMATALAPQAWAQTPAPAEAAAAEATAPKQDSTKPGATIAVVEVTAQKTRENPQKVPIALTAIGGDDLAQAGIGNATALRAQVTGLAVVEQGPAASIQIRGVGSNPGGGNIDPSVALGVDGVYQSRGSSAFGAFYDLERVEVLKGPQGTLYGRNATVGAVNVISRRPGKQLEGELTLEAGNYDLLRGFAAVNVPISDTVKLRAAVQAVKRDGYLSDGYNDADDQAGRLKVLIEPSKDLSLMLTADMHRKGGNGQGNVFTGTVANFNADGSVRSNPFAPWTNANSQTHTPARDDANDAWHLLPVVATPCTTAGCYNNAATTGLNSVGHVGTGHAEPPNGGLSIRNDGLTAELNWQLGGSTLTVLPAYRRSYVANQSGTSGNLLIPAFSIIDQTQKSLEVRLASAPGPLRWIAGAFYLDEDAPTTQIGRSANSATLTTGSSTYTEMTTVNAVTKAAFGQATWAVTPELRLTGGLRYTADEKQQHGRIYCRTALATDGSGGPCTGLWAPYANATQAIDSHFSDNALNYKLGVDMDLAKDSMVYATLSTGYKSGGLNFMPDNGTATSRAVFKPETLKALAIGSKNRLMGGKLQLNSEFFIWRYRNQQIALVDQFDASASAALSPVANLLFINNPGTSRISGLDVDAVFALTENDRLNASLSLLRARNGSFKVNATQFVIPIGPGQTLVNPLEASTDVSGKTLPFAPKVQLNLGYQHFFDLASGATITASFDGHYESSSYVNYHLFAPEYQPAYFRSNASLGYASADGRFSITGWVRNISNEAVLTRGSVGGGGGGSQAAHYANIAEPRTFGATVTLKF